MDYTNCPLYNLKSKKRLKQILQIDTRYYKQDFLLPFISAYIDHTAKPRLIEPPNSELKTVQKRVKRLLGKIIVPDNVFSGIKGRSYVDNVQIHVGEKRRNIYKIDLIAFFPSITRNTVYNFFFHDLDCSPDVAEILTNFTTVDISKIENCNHTEIYDFLSSKGIKSYNHLISGAPTSQIMSYLVNRKMFDELQKLCDENNVVMSIYVDDITFSSESRISKSFTDSVAQIIKKFGYQISGSKSKKYKKIKDKLITGVVINSEGKMVLKNAMRQKIVLEFEHLKQNPDDSKSRKRLQGLLLAARQVEKNAFPGIYKFAFQLRTKPCN